MGILCLNLNNINTDEANYKEYDPETIIQVRLLAWHSKFGKRKALKKEVNKELMREVWHTLRWWDWYLPEDQKNETKSTFTEKVEG